MKTLLSILLLSAFSAVAIADIQEPPAAQYGPGRQLGRGLSNLLLGITELPVTVAANTDEHGSSALPNSVLQGFIRVLYRYGAGWHDLVTFPFPNDKGSYRPPYDTPASIYGHAGYAEFPPELGFESRYHYCRAYTATSSQ